MNIHRETAIVDYFKKTLIEQIGVMPICSF